MIKHKKLGFAFRDEVLKVTGSTGIPGKRKINTEKIEDAFLVNFNPAENKETISPWRIVILGCLFLFIFFGLFLRVFHLQVVQGEENRQRADVNRIQIRTLHASRGVIYDRNGKILTQNIPLRCLDLLRSIDSTNKSSYFNTSKNKYSTHDILAAKHLLDTFLELYTDVHTPVVRLLLKDGLVPVKNNTSCCSIS